MKQIHASKGARDRVIEKMLANREKDWDEDKEGTVMWKQRIYVP
jgi:hypothetical protein